ncbi:GIY-YIG nuclease family protein [Schwartzia succinivorans]|uniref:T5orf172 domain-containing protein n=1 Tax=Schwartzia succinivorans DSM 10502 TaxID=1123243 RepID=A0A1M4UHF9_9FIRM|nr:GIY-YIG nuclease family protein [Schwartzia succinivorans]SHE56181.1 T5orf172 domain-containing protein [Schwartzia succinivorans DSM 10502]
MEKGFIYIMTNPALRDMVKIGYAADVEKRRKQLSSTGLPYDYEVYATYETSGNLEDLKLHKMIDKLNPDLRVVSNKEFFVMTPQEAYELLENIATISGTMDKLKKIKVDETKKQTVKKPAVNFAKCGIPVGAELVFTEDPTVKVTVISDRKVQWNEEETSLSAVAALLKHSKAIQGSAFFTYNGKLITKIAEETQWNDY